VTRQSRCVVLEEFGAPLAVRDLLVDAPPPGGLVVGVRYGGVCGTDAHLHRGKLPITTPVVLGHEGLGVVEELGAGPVHGATGSPLRVGETVMWASSISCGTCVPCRLHGEPTLCENRSTYGVTIPVGDGPGPAGSWSRYMCLRPGTTVVPLPDDTDPLAAMAFACAVPTMVHALRRRPVRLGETVLVQGSGPVGLAAAALAHLAGAATVIIVGGPRRRLDQAANAGIGDHHLDVVGPGGPDAALARALELTGGRGADLVVECSGAPEAVGQGLRLARRGGAYLIVGQYTDRGDTAVNPHQFVHRQLTVVGSWGFTGAHLAGYVGFLPELTHRFDLVGLVTTFALDAAGHALEHVTAGSVLKAVLETP
jgi:threonine dehydrogenase-like Zn-dependent dehydrogenase